MDVKTKKRGLQAGRPWALRSFCERNRISRTALAAALGTGRRYVCDVLHADTNGKCVSAKQWRLIWQTALELAREGA